MVGLAQLARASGCGPEGRGFETHISPQKSKSSDLDFFNVKHKMALRIFNSNSLQQLVCKTDGNIEGM